MTELLRKYLLLLRRPDDEGGARAGDPPDDAPDDAPEDDPEDDETSDDPTDEEDDDAEDDQPDAAARSGHDEPRGRRQFGQIRAERRRLNEENARLTRELAEARNARQQPYQPQETPEQREARLALMAPEDRIRTEFREELQRRDAQHNHTTLQLLDGSDKAAWEAKCASNPAARKLSPDVERRLGDLRRQGHNLARDAVFTWIMGERAVAALGKGRDAAATNRRRQAAAPANGRGDVASDRGARRATPDNASEFERRFGDVPI